MISSQNSALQRHMLMMVRVCWCWHWTIVYMLDPVASSMNNSVQSIHQVSSKCEHLTLLESVLVFANLESVHGRLTLLFWDCSRHVICGSQGALFTQAVSTVPHTVRIT